MEFDNARVAANLRALRIARGKTQGEVAADNNISAATLRNYESAYAVMNLERAFSLARYFGVTIEDLIR